MTLAIAHRGDPIQFRENTLPAIRAAAAAGADMVEIDLKLTSDAQVVLLHDATMERLWGFSRPVTGLSLAELAAFNGEADQRVPTLLEVLAEFGRPHPLQFMLNVTSVDTALATDAWCRSSVWPKRCSTPVRSRRYARSGRTVPAWSWR
ncbi:glycerophosphodiester phosphodiesterase [Allosalinactinospora lopnorensis]|uniref:glycerophosphodiester phosphodiesterase n=1 Tax=Allosalinactinospora lopnorensis TaxID=1352348 RepID=UPI0006964436|nr:glycerophosphodiester phosphodiesterase family protein [Allosalinactinospora lopnorensis]